MMIVLCLLLLCLATLEFQRGRQPVSAAPVIAGSEVWRSDALANCDAAAEFCRTDGASSMRGAADAIASARQEGNLAESTMYPHVRAGAASGLWRAPLF
jgi:hypothetical protein